MEALPTGVLIADAGGRYLEANAAASRILGYPREALLASGLPEARSNLLNADGSVLSPEETPGVLALRSRKPVLHQVLGLVRENGDTQWLEVSAEPLPEGGVLVCFDDITRQHLTESILAARARIAEMAATATLEEVLRATLDEVERLTGSCLGFFHFMEADQKTLTLQAWSTRTENEFCMAIGKGMHYSVDEGGVWADAIHARKPVIHNDYASLPHKKGMPEGHATVLRELVVPVLRGERIVALLGIGNKPFPYGNRDLQTVLRLADLAWDITARKRAEQEVKSAKDMLGLVLDSLNAHVAVLDADGNILTVNEPWRRFARENGITETPGTVEQANYLSAMAGSSQDSSHCATDIRQGLEGVLSGLHPAFQVEYPCDTPTEPRWFRTHMLALQSDQGGAVITHEDITEEKLAYASLQNSEARFRSMFEAAPIGLWEEDFSEIKARFDALRQAGVCDLRAHFDEHPGEVADLASRVRILRINEASVLSLKAESEGDIVRELPRYFTPGSLQIFKEELLALAAGKTRFRVEGPHLDAHGQLLFFDIGFTVQPGHEESLSRVLVSFLDITGQKQTEDSLRASESRLQTLTEHSPDHILLLDLDGTILYINHVLPGHRLEEVIGQNWLNWMTPSAREIAHRAFTQVIESGHRIDYEVEGMGSPGESRWYGCRLGPVLENGVVESLVLFSTDISERKQADMALLRSEHQYRSLFDSMKEGFALHEILLDEGGQPIDYRFLDVNPAFVAMTGLPRGQWIGRTVREVLPGIEPRWIQGYGEVARTGKSITFEDESRDLGRWYRVTAYRPGLGKFAVLVTDITEHKRTESEHRLLEQQVARTQKMESLGSLAGGVAHDMNNVLGAIMGLASIHQEQAPEGTRLHKSMSTILMACTRGRTLVKGLLGFARQGLEEVRLLDLNEVIREEVALLERTIPANVRIVPELAPGLNLIHGDPASLSHVLMNLCVNAMDAMPGGGSLYLRTRNEGPDLVCLELADTGCGMAPDVLEKALDPFYTTKSHGKGTGLGLAIVYGSVKAHHGMLELSSSPGAGTSVLMRFPATSSPPLPGTPSHRTFHAGHALDILVVDDDELIQDSLVELLQSMGHRPTVARCGEDALRLLEQGLAAEVVLLDLNMPGLGGAGTLPRLRAAYPDLPILLATGRADQSAMDLVAHTSKTLLLPKPFSVAELNSHFRQLGLD